MKINSHHLSGLLDIYLGRLLVWINVNRLRVLFFVFIVFMWSVLSWLPYFNLVFTKELVVFLVLVSLSLIFRIDWKAILYFCFGLFLIACFFDFLGLLPLSESIGNYIYGCLALVAIKYFLSI